MTLYLLDANVLIRAHEDYYPIDRIPRFWAWLLEQAQASIIKIPAAVYDEIEPSRGQLAEWIRQPNVKSALVLVEPTDVLQVRIVLAHYAPDLTDVETEQIGADPFLVAAALRVSGRVVVTREVSKPSRKRANRKLPDVCAEFGVAAMTDFELYRRLEFSIK